MSTLQDLKGFEFKHVIVVGCGDRIFPFEGVHKDEKWRDALRLYVTMTRARDQIHLIYNDEQKPSEFISSMGDLVDTVHEVSDRKFHISGKESDPKEISLGKDSIHALHHIYVQMRMN